MRIRGEVMLLVVHSYVGNVVAFAAYGVFSVLSLPPAIFYVGKRTGRFQFTLRIAVWIYDL